MEAYKLQVVLVAMVLGIAILGSEQTILSANGLDICGVGFSDLLKCKSATRATNPTPPSASCCSALSNADFACLCQYSNSTLLSDYGIDPKQAMQIPVKCQLVDSSFHC